MLQLEQSGMLLDFESGDALTFDLNPESFFDSDTTNFASVAIPGMSHPRLQFTGGGERTLTFSIVLHYGACGKSTVKEQVDFLRGWLYPDYQGGRLSAPPHRLTFWYGDNWRDEEWVLRNMSVEHRRHDIDSVLIYAVVSLELVEYINTSRSRKEVARI